MHLGEAAEESKVGFEALPPSDGHDHGGRGSVAHTEIREGKEKRGVEFWTQLCFCGYVGRKT